MSSKVITKEFVVDANNQIIDNPTLKHIQIVAKKITGEDDAYLIKLDAGSKISIDIDGRFNSKLSVFDASGNKIATNSSNSRIEMDEAGSFYKYDPYVSFVVNHHGIYTIVLENGSGEYILGISKDASVSVLEDSRDNLINALGDGVDDHGDTLIIQQVDNPKYGVTKLVDNQILYTPSKDYFGKDEFGYVYSDGNNKLMNAVYELSVMNVYDIAKSDFKVDSGNISIDESDLPTASIFTTKTSVDDKYYSLYLLKGEVVIIDVDARFSSKLTLFDANGNKVASNGSSSRIEIDEVGNTYKYDPFIKYMAVNAGEYQIKLENGAGDYQLHISKDNTQAVIETDLEVENLIDAGLVLSSTTLTAHYASLLLNNEDYTNQSIDAVSRIHIALDFDAIKSQLNGADKITGIEFNIQVGDELDIVSTFATKDNNEWLMDVDFLSDFNAAIANNITSDVVVQHIPGIVNQVNNKVDLLDVYLNPKTSVELYTITLKDIVILTDIGKVALNSQQYIVNVNLKSVTTDDVYFIEEDGVNGVDINTIVDNDLQFTVNDYPLENISFITDFKLGVVNDKGIYAPNKNASGVDIASYQLIDGDSKSNISNVVINIASINDAPAASDDYFENVLLEDGKAIDITHIVNNDSDAEDKVLFYKNVKFITEFDNGELTDQGFYTPNENYYGFDKASYVVKDSSAAVSEVGNITIEIHSVNDNPSGRVSVSGVMAPGEVLTASNNLQDVDGLGDVSYQWLRGDQYIAGEIASSYTVSRKDIGYSLSVQAIYTDQAGTKEIVKSDITKIVEDNNIAPIATDDLVVMAEDSSVMLNLLNNDNDQNNDAITIYSYTSPKHGRLSENITGQLTYTPDLNFTDKDEFSYIIKDAFGAISGEASVGLIVNASNIVFKPLVIINSSTISLSEAMILLNKDKGDKLDSNTPVLRFDIVLDASKIDVFSANAQSIAGVQFKITPSLLSDDWLLGYQLNDNFDLSLVNIESAAFAIGNADAIVDNDTSNDFGREKTIETQSLATVFVNLADDIKSVDVTLQDLLLEARTENGEYISIAPNDFSANLLIDAIDTMETVQESLESEAITEATLKNDTFFVNEDEISSLNVLINDKGLDIDIASFTNPSHGSIELKESDVFIYTVDNNYYGSDSFTYLTNQNDTPITVDIEVYGVNDKPVANNIITQMVSENTLYSIDLSDYFSDTDVDDNLTYQAMMSNGADLPSWLILNTKTGILSGTSRNQDVANLEIKVLALDNSNESIEIIFDLLVNEVADGIVYAHNGILLDDITPQYFINSEYVDVQHSVINGNLIIKEDFVFDSIKVDEGKYTQNAINISDAISVLRHIVDLDPIESSSVKYHAADVNNDGNVNISDAISILRHIVDLETLETFDLIDQQGNKVDRLSIETPLEIPEYYLISNGDVDFSGEFITSIDIV